MRIAKVSVISVSVLFLGATLAIGKVSNKKQERYKKKSEALIKEKNESTKGWDAKRVALNQRIRPVPDRVRMQKPHERIYELVEIKGESAKKWDAKTRSLLASIGKDSFTSGR